MSERPRRPLSSRDARQNKINNSQRSLAAFKGSGYPDGQAEIFKSGHLIVNSLRDYHLAGMSEEVAQKPACFIAIKVLKSEAYKSPLSITRTKMRIV